MARLTLREIRDTARLWLFEAALCAVVWCLPPGEPREVLRRMHAMWFDRYTVQL